MSSLTKTIFILCKVESLILSTVIYGTETAYNEIILISFISSNEAYNQLIFIFISSFIEIAVKSLFKADKI